MVEKLDVKEVSALLEDIVASKPEGYMYARHDKTIEYPACTYFWDNEPDCIIGHLLARTGFTAVSIGYGYINEVCRKSEVPEVYRKDIADRFTDAAVDFMQTVQSAQDSGHTWREALDYARACTA